MITKHPNDHCKGFRSEGTGITNFRVKDQFAVKVTVQVWRVLEKA